jgi:tRNA A-37 threonylcarbamoyl transferase component Bud32
VAEQLGRYRAERRLGTGAFATVWLAHDDALDAQVAIKVLADNWAHDDDIRRRFMEEARILWRLDSDRIVRVHAVDTLADGRPYFVMDYADLGSLADRMRTRVDAGQQYSQAEALAIAIEVAEGLTVAHGLDIVHRDLKPSNILYRTVAAHTGDARTERMVLADFGIARSMEGTVATTIAAGTPHYMAPEQAEGRADRRSDVYGAAVVLYELLAGQLPYPGESVGQVLRAQLTTTPPPMSTLRDDVDPRFDAVLARGLATDPDDRYGSVVEWADALRAIRDDPAEVGAAGGETAVRSEDPRATRTNVSAGSAASAGAGVAAAAGGGGVAAAAGGAAGGGSGPLVPSGPPPSGGSAGAGGSGGGTGARTRRKNQRVVAAVAIVLLVGLVGGIALATGGGGSKKASAAEIARESFDSTGSNPFTGTVVVPNVTIPKTIPNVPGAPTFPPKLTTAGAPTTIPASTPGLYGGTQQLSVCDVKQMLTFLQSNPDKAAAWAKVLGIPTAVIPTFVDDLTSVILRSDTRVTNHGFANGQATELQSVLQAGTAVLVDRFGVPVVRCYCGNPLTPPKTVDTPAYTGPSWPGFDPGRVVVVERPTTPIINIVLINILTGTTFQRPVGTDGRSDVNVTLKPRSPTSSSSSTSTTTTTTTTVAPTQVVDASHEGTVTASSTFPGGQYPASNALDGSAATSWFSAGSADGDTSTFTWQGARTDLITDVVITGNAQNADPSVRSGFGFNSITVQVLDGDVVKFSQDVAFPDASNGNSVTVKPNVKGQIVRLLLHGHQDPTCGGFGEIQVGVAR